MLRLAVLFLVVALIAALFGFGLVADYSWAGAKILFFVFLVLAVLSYPGRQIWPVPRTIVLKSVRENGRDWGDAASVESFPSNDSPAWKLQSSRARSR